MCSTSSWSPALTQSSAPGEGRNYSPKHVELIEIINKLLLLLLLLLLLFLVSMESRIFKFCWNSECIVLISILYCSLYCTAVYCTGVYTVLLSITARKVIYSQVHPPSKPSFDVFVDTVDDVFVFVVVVVVVVVVVNVLLLIISRLNHYYTCTHNIHLILTIVYCFTMTWDSHCKGLRLCRGFNDWHKKIVMRGFIYLLPWCRGFLNGRCPENNNNAGER